MTEIGFMMQYRRDGIMGGDNIRDDQCISMI